MNIKYVIVKNEMPASSSEAAYLGKIIPNGVRNRAQMTANALKSEHFAEATFAAVLDTAVALTQELCAEGRDVDWGPVKFLAKMHGSLPCEDSAFEDGTASLTVDADGTNSTRAVLETLVPVKASVAEIASLIKVSNVMDVATEQFGTVIGSTEYAILGNGITLDQEGEYAKALDRKTLEVKGTAQVLRVSKGQRAYCKFVPQLSGGDYTLEVATKGLLGETTPRIFRKPITAVYVPPPPPSVTKVTSPGTTGVVKGLTIEAVGTSLGNVTGAKVKWTEGGVAKEQNMTPSTVTDTKLTFPAVTAFLLTPNGTELTFEFIVGGTTLTKTSVLYPVVPIAESASGDIKIFTLEGMNFTTPSGPMTGLNVGLDVESNNGIVSISTDILGTTYDWPSEGGTAGFASSETMFGLPVNEPTPPPSGTYDVTMRCTRGTGEPGEFETITIPNVRIIVP